MSDGDESISLPGDGVLSPWFQALDAGIQSLGQLLDFSSDMFKRMAREQHDAVGVCLDTVAGGLSWESPETVGRKAVATGTALITGGTGGLGTEICRRLAADGNHVVSTYIAAEKNVAREWRRERAREGLSVDLYECDVTDYESCRALARTLEERYGPVEIIINCAGITRDTLLRKMDEGDWHAVLDTNLDSVFNVTRPFIDGMIKNGYGRVINISSVNGQKGQFGQTNYSAAKAGMIGFTRSLALELAQTGITVNCVCPGYVATSMVEAIREDILEGIVAQIPVGRLARPEEIADAVAFLAKRDSAYITGTEIAVNGGLWLG